MRYGIWNNKGGVGKTFLSFIIGAEFARTRPNEKVILVDMCPQANLSEIILGGNDEGSKHLEAILGKPSRKTVGGYFDSRISSPHQKTGHEVDYLIHGQRYNENLPSNLYLLCGDPSLELQAQVISQIGGQTLPVDAWKNVRSWLKDLVLSCMKKLGDDTTVFIDCNPSFSAYTELSVIASDRLIIPCSSDGSSARAIDNVAALLYGFGTNPQHNQVNFFARASQYDMTLPLVHSVILNRSTLYHKGASKAFQAMFDAIEERVEKFRLAKPEAFVSGNPNFPVMPDSHSVAIVCSHKGLPLHLVKPGKYEVYDTTPQVNKVPLDRYNEKVAILLSLL